MDTMSIGLVSFDQFQDLMSKSNVKLRDEGDSHKIQDSFEWEQAAIQQLAGWIKDKNFTVSEAFRAIDQDFDGNISIGDLRAFLIEALKYEPHEIADTKLSRLYKILDISKSGKIFLSDFEAMFSQIQQRKLLDSISNGWSQVSHKSRLSFKDHASVNNLSEVEQRMFDWQPSCIFQIGQYLSKHYKTVEESYEVVVGLNQEESPKVRMNDFINFITQKNILQGFNLTQQLMQKLFASMDPHKKGYLTLNDWKNLFSHFNDVGSIMLDVQNAIASAFDSIEEAFGYMIDKSQSREINLQGFIKVVNQLLPMRFDPKQLKDLWQTMMRKNSQTLTQSEFWLQFDGLRFKKEAKFSDSLAKQLAKTSIARSMSQASNIGSRASYSQFQNLEQLLLSNQSHLVSQIAKESVSQSRSDFNSMVSGMLDSVTSEQVGHNLVLEKLKILLKTMGVSDIKQVFQSTDQSKIASVEFKNVMRKIGLNTREVDRLSEILVCNNEGLIDLDKLNARINKIDNDEEILDKRNTHRINALKRMMFEYMTSPEDAFRFFDKENKGRLTYYNFQAFISHLYSLANQEQPNYPVIKDLFDQIDIRKDGIVDQTEWAQTFMGGLAKKSVFLSGLGQTNVKDSNGSWITSKEYLSLLTLISKNRKSIEEYFKSHATQTENLLPFEAGKSLFISYIKEHFHKQDPSLISIEDWKIEQIASPFQQLKNGEMSLHYSKMLDVIKQRQRALAGFPK